MITHTNGMTRSKNRKGVVVFMSTSWTSDREMIGPLNSVLAPTNYGGDWPRPAHYSQWSGRRTALSRHSHPARDRKDCSDDRDPPTPVFAESRIPCTPSNGPRGRE